MKVLVTGGAGFIGSHIAEALVRRGANVVVLDNMSTGDPKNLAWAGPNSGLELIEGDICDSTLVEKIVRGCDWIFHEAAAASVPYSVAEPELTNRQNLEATLHLLEVSRRSKVRRFIFASSSAVYGELDRAANEQMAVNPMSPYALQKYASEKYGQLFTQLYGLETAALRYFNVFGPRQNAASPYSGVIALFCQKALKGENPTIFGDGKQSRDFVYIENVVEANLLAAESSQAAGKTFNIGMGSSVTLLELIGELDRLTHQQSKPEFKPARAGDIRYSEAKIDSARMELGYDPKVSWKEGLRRTVDFYRGM